MLTNERRTQFSAMHQEPARALGIVLKCAVCLALVMLLAVIGSGEDKVEMANGARAPRPESAAKVSSAAAHRKAVFDARRARFESGASDHNVVGTAPATPAATLAP